MRNRLPAISGPRRIVSLLCAAVAVGLIVYGMILPFEQDQRWIACLWGATLFALLAVRLTLPPMPRGAARNVQRLGVLFCVGFAMLTVQLLRMQVVRSQSISDFVYVDQRTGQSTSNVRPVLEAQRISRGKIVDRTGIVLAESATGENGLTRRVYPGAPGVDSASLGNVVGYFSHRYGSSGLEASYNDYLSGERDTVNQLEHTFLGRPRVGDDLQLTLDARLQQAAREVLGNRTGSVVVLDPRTGAVLALASAPTFNPAGLAFDPGAPRAEENARIAAYWTQLNADDAGQPLISRPTQGVYPPGSTYKTVTSIAALENPSVGQPDTIDCPNERPTAPGAPPVVNAVDNLEGIIRRVGPPNLERVYAFSCNTAFAEYAMRLGPQAMIDAAARFDIVRPSEAEPRYAGFRDLPTETSTLYAQEGFLNNRAALADTGYGQGQLQVTPLQMAMVAAAVANDGVMMRPYLVDRITRPDGTLIVRQPPTTIRRAMSSSTASKMRSDMRAVVEYGFGRSAQGMSRDIAVVGGKSGTAEHGVGRPPHAWFIAIAPVENPRYAVAVMIENGVEGSSVGADAAGRVLAAAFALEK